MENNKDAVSKKNNMHIDENDNLGCDNSKNNSKIEQEQSTFAHNAENGKIVMKDVKHFDICHTHKHSNVENETTRNSDNEDCCDEKELNEKHGNKNSDDISGIDTIRDENANNNHNHAHNHAHSHDHTSSHSHNHSHGLLDHDHSHDNMEFVKHKKNKFRLILVLALTLGIAIAEIIISFLSNSLSLMADSGHMFADTVGLVLALYIANLTERPADDKGTWGYKRAEILGALAQAVLLIAISASIVVSAISRLINPLQIHADSMGVMGVVGLVANGISIFILMSSQKDNMNMGAAFLEVLADTLGSIGVVVAAGLIYITKIYLFDIIVSVFIALFIIFRAVIIGKKATNILLERVPQGIDLKAINKHISAIEHVREIHDLHISMIATGLPVLSAHVVVEDECFTDNHSRIILDQVQHCLSNHFSIPIKHVTIQLESPEHRVHEYDPCNQ